MAQTWRNFRTLGTNANFRHFRQHPSSKSSSRTERASGRVSKCDDTGEFVATRTACTTRSSPRAIGHQASNHQLRQAAGAAKIRERSAAQDHHRALRDFVVSLPHTMVEPMEI